MTDTSRDHGIRTGQTDQYKEDGPLTRRQRQMAAALVKTRGNVAAAARELGVHRSRGQQLANHPKVRPFLLEVVERFTEVGLTPEHVATRLYEATNADRTYIVPDGKGGGVVVEKPDHLVRVKAIQAAADLVAKALTAGVADSEEAPLLSAEAVQGMTVAELMRITVTRQRVLR